MENNSSNAPFYIGQEVVAMKSSPVHKSGHKVVKGSIYTCAGCFWSECCKCWYIAIDELDGDFDNSTCKIHGLIIWHSGVFKLIAKSKHFAPVSRLRISDELTIAEDLFQTKPVEERADVLIPETIKN